MIQEEVDFITRRYEDIDEEAKEGGQMNYYGCMDVNDFWCVFLKKHVTHLSSRTKGDTKNERRREIRVQNSWKIEKEPNNNLTYAHLAHGAIIHVAYY